jgi:NF-kappa-B inhibitor-like protein 2
LTGRTFFIQSENISSKDGTTSALHKALEAFQRSLQVCEELRSKGDVKEVEYFEMKARLYLNIGKS